MRLVLASAALVAAFFAQIPAGQAQSGNKPWCAVVNIGWGDAAEICEYNTVEECQPNVIAGNRGFCNVKRQAPRQSPLTAPWGRGCKASALLA